MTRRLALYGFVSGWSTAASRPAELDIPAVVRGRRKLHAARVRVRGLLHRGEHGPVLLGSGCSKDAGAFGKPWACGLAVSASPRAEESVAALLRARPARNEEDPEVIVEGRLFASPKVKVKGGAEVEIGAGPLNRFAAWLEADRIEPVRTPDRK